MNDRSSLAAEIFLWAMVVAICLAGIVTVLADDLFSSSARAPASTAQPR